MGFAVDLFSTLATIALIVMLLGPAPAIREIHRTHSTGVTALAPLVSLFLNSWIWAIYGYLDETIFPVGICNLIGTVLSFIYTCVFYRHTPDRAYAHKVIGGFGSVALIFTVYAFLGGYGVTNQSREAVKNVFGYVGVVTVFIFFASPFENMGQVLKYRSGVFIPILMVAAGAVNTAMWVVYSLLTTDWFIFVPNAGALLIAITQIVLYFVFHPSTHPYTATADDLEASLQTPAGAKQALASPVYVPMQSPLDAPSARV